MSDTKLTDDQVSEILSEVAHYLQQGVYKTRAGEPNPFRVGVKASPLADERKI